MNIAVMELFYTFMESGGVVLYFLFFTCAMILFICSGKLMQLRRYSTLLKSNTITQNSWFVDEYPGSIHGNNSVNIKQKDLTEELLFFHTTQLTNGLSTMTAWISVAPLFGLLGTVIGMVKTFKLITLFGIGNPTMVSDGISVALITTQAGLTVAFPGLLLLNYCKNKKNHILHALHHRCHDLCKGDHNEKR